MRAYDEWEITVERLEELKKKAFLLEDELMRTGFAAFERTGKLNDPGLSAMSVEYENLSLDIAGLEKLLNIKHEDE